MLKWAAVKLRYGLIAGFAACSVGVSANTCFNFAETYYQQIYCEIKATGKGSGLPSFTDFRRNNEQMQALLLKPFARKAGVAMPMPQPAKKAIAVSRDIEQVAAAQDNFSSCSVSALLLQCAAGDYQLVRNQANNQLATGVLAADYRMNLPRYHGDVSEDAAVNAYLVDAYQHYLQKMIAIGLGGSTMRYGKFAYLFADLNSKGMDFSDRFEKMFGFLKKDKRRLNVPVISSIPGQLDLAQCFSLQQFLLCPLGQKNLVFTRQ